MPLQPHLLADLPARPDVFPYSILSKRVMEYDLLNLIQGGS
jgi:hypothetical protein